MTRLRITAVAIGLLGSSFAIGQASAAMPANGLALAEKQISAGVQECDGLGHHLRSPPLLVASGFMIGDGHYWGSHPWHGGDGPWHRWHMGMAPVASLVIVLTN